MAQQIHALVEWKVAAIQDAVRNCESDVERAQTLEDLEEQFQVQMSLINSAMACVLCNKATPLVLR